MLHTILGGKHNTLHTGHYVTFNQCKLFRELMFFILKCINIHSKPIVNSSKPRHVLTLSQNCRSLSRSSLCSRWNIILSTAQSTERLCPRYRAQICARIWSLKILPPFFLILDKKSTWHLGDFQLPYITNCYFITSQTDGPVNKEPCTSLWWHTCL